MKIVILGPISAVGGVITVIKELTAEFINRGDNVTIVTLDSKPFSLNLASEDSSFSIFSTSKPSRLGVVSKFIPIFKIITFLRNEKYDLVISNLYYSPLLKFCGSAKKIHVIHGIGISSNNFQQWFRCQVGNYSNAVGAKFADRVVSCSYLAAVFNFAMFGTNAKVIPWGVTPPQNKYIYSENERDIDILFVGRLAKTKMIAVALKAVEILVKRYDFRVNVHIIGEGSEESRLRTFAKELDIEDQVVFHGYLSDEQVNTYYSRARCFISLHPAEGFGLTYLEALVRGTPIILCRSSGFSHFCHNDFSCFIDLSVESVALGIKDSLSRSWDREWIARYTTEKFSWSSTAQEIIDSAFDERSKLDDFHQFRLEH